MRTTKRGRPASQPPSAPLAEKLRRRPTFTAGEPVWLADGSPWHLPEIGLRIRAEHEPTTWTLAGRDDPEFGSRFDDAIGRLAAGGDDMKFRDIIRLAHVVLAVNYHVTHKETAWLIHGGFLEKMNMASAMTAARDAVDIIFRVAVERPKEAMRALLIARGVNAASLEPGSVGTH